MGAFTLRAPAHGLGAAQNILLITWSDRQAPRRQTPASRILSLGDLHGHSDPPDYMGGNGPVATGGMGRAQTLMKTSTGIPAV